VEEGIWGTFSRIGLFLKYTVLSILWVAAIILMGWLDRDLGDYSVIAPGGFEPIDLNNLNIDLNNLNIDFGIDSIDFSHYLIEPVIKPINLVLVKEHDLNWMFEMGLEIPFISDLNDLYKDIVDVHEKELSAWDKWLTEPSYPFDWEGYKEGQAMVDDLDVIDPNIILNSLAHGSNSNLNYDVIDIFSNRLIVTNDAILNSLWFQSLIDIAEKITVSVTENGEQITNLTINTDVANAFIASSIDSVDSSGSGSLEYENAIRAIRSTPVITNSPEFIEMFESINGTRALSIVEVSPTSPEVLDSTVHDPSVLERMDQMRVDFRERISLLFSHQLPDAQPMPLWFEVPPRPTEPWAIEIWERDNAIRDYWATRLNGGYTIQTTTLDPEQAATIQTTF